MTKGLTSAVIVGGGIGGLATALALARSGIASHVCERRAVFPEEGAGIQIGPNGARILRPSASPICCKTASQLPMP